MKPIQQNTQLGQTRLTTATERRIVLGFVAAMLLRYLIGLPGGSFAIRWSVLVGLCALAGLGIYWGSGDDVRRVVNIVAALIGLILAAPLMALIALVIKLTSPGPVIFTQVRVGLDRRRRFDHLVRPCMRTNDMGGQPFTIYKFRTMSHSDSTEQVWADENDSRITLVGKFLRSTRLDELPQLVNVLVGDMNIVGPRPEQPEIFQRLRSEVDRYHLRQRVRPGITGWAQINQHYDTCTDDVRRKVDFDLEYISKKSAKHDLGIMLKTVPVVVGRKGAR